MRAGFAPAREESPNGVKTLDPPGAIKAVGTWSLGARAGDFIFVAGMQGVDPATNKLVEDPQARIRQAFLNLKTIAQSEGASLKDCVRLTFYLSDLPRYAPMGRPIRRAPWSRSSAYTTTTSPRSTAFSTRRRRSEARAIHAPDYSTSSMQGALT